VLKLQCATFDQGLVHPVEVESSLTNGLPQLQIVGLASSSIQEAKERVKAALQACGLTLPPKRITINLAPSDIKKSGSHFDLALALAIALPPDISPPSNLFLFGELGLDGTLKETSAIFPLVLALAKEQRIQILAPAQSASKLAAIPNITLYPIAHLQEAIAFFKEGPPQPYPTRSLSYPKVLGKYYYTEDYPLDFAQVRGQKFAIRGALIAAAGWHNILLEGSPGSGKSMIAKRLRYILPPMELAEILEVARLEALEGREPTFAPIRPFRAPHHSATRASIFGGGSHQPQPGEVAYANKGILFFDELPHFSKGVLEALREPLQERRLLVSRVNCKVEYESDFLFVAAQNPCPCGNLLSRSKECRCNEVEIRRYRSKLSEPLKDRIDLFVSMGEPLPDQPPVTSSRKLHAQVHQAFIKQIQRQGTLNGKLDEKGIERYCHLDSEAKSLLDRMAKSFGLSLRRIASLKRVARTIADLAGQEHIGKRELLEAGAYLPKDPE